ncbi:MAG: cytochrome-c oxidase, cbb3-type subunit III [Gammaproteobacteria bacterium]|nr:cytochrome-c oxidase, cbb3-type subunit III [Gammaproteobacteria bacterium]
MSSLVSAIVIIGTLGSIAFFFALLQLNRSVTKPGETTGHAHDGIEEYDNPLPSWWYWGFVLTMVFSLAYLIYYPGLGNFEGLGNWSQTSELEQAMAQAEEKYSPIFAQYRDIPIDELAANTEAMKIGRRLFSNNCAVCHGAGGTGSYGFPNLTDGEWQWGSSNEQVTATIMNGRTAVMTPFLGALGNKGVRDAASYVMQLAGRDVDEESAARGETHFNSYCVACHGRDGKGNPLMGAPDLTNEIWLYGNSRLRIEHTIKHGRNGMMPAFKGKLGEDKAHIVAAYVKSLASKSRSNTDSGGE